MQNGFVIGIIGAMDVEVSLLRERMADRREIPVCDLTFSVGEIEGRRVALVKSGIGKVNAARCTQMLIDRFSPSVIVNTGIAGALDPALNVGDAVIATSLVQHDFNAAAFGYARGYMCTGVDNDRPTTFTADPVAAAALQAAACRFADAHAVTKGVIASGDLFVAEGRHKQKIRDTFGAAAAEMESAAIAQTAAAAGVPFAVLRVMSDRADGGAPDSYAAFEEDAANRSAEIVCAFLRAYAPHPLPRAAADVAAHCGKRSEARHESHRRAASHFRFHPADRQSGRNRCGGRRRRLYAKGGRRCVRRP